MDGVKEISDLKVGLELEGVITNVANFGAFVDIGVHQDGLVHVSQLADRFISDPTQVVKVGQVVKVRVLEVNEKLKRISLSMKSGGSGENPVSSQPPALTKERDRASIKPQTKPQPQPQTQLKQHPTSPTLEDLQAKFGKKRS